ncbi:MAG: hypothetical protein ACI4J6_11025 [Oscillospiraceae bacterium]
MKMKRMIAIMLTFMMIGSLTACDGDKKENTPETSSQTESENESAAPETQESEETEPAEPTVEQVLDTYYYKATLNLPASEAGDGSLESKYVVEESTQRGSSDCGIASDTVAIELTYKSYTFQTNMYYQEKYGEKDPNFENYVEYMLDSSLQDAFTTGIEETKVGDYEALKYIYNGVNYVLNVDGLPAQFIVAVIPLTEDADPEALAADPEINSIINSIKVEALNN